MNRSKTTVSERILVVAFDSIADDEFEQNLLDWKKFCQSVFPDGYHEKQGKWNFKIKGNGVDIPEIDEPEIKILNRFWSNPKESITSSDWVFQVCQTFFTVNLRKQKIEDGGSFPMLKEQFLKVWPEFCKIFRISKISHIDLSFIMTLSSDTINDETLARPHWLEVKEIAYPFAAISYPEHCEMFLRPYNLQQNWKAVVDKQEFVLNSLFDAPANENFINMHFTAVKVTADCYCASLLDTMYALITGIYNATFTEKVKKVIGEDWV